MKAARSGIAAIVLLAAGAAVALAQLETADRARAADPVRERAEDLAKAASQRFSEVMKDGRPAEPQGKQRSGAVRGRRSLVGGAQVARALQPRLQVDRAAPQQGRRSRHGAGHAAAERADSQAAEPQPGPVPARRSRRRAPAPRTG